MDAPPTRYRCTACGNLTRFTVIVSTRERAFYHFTLGGELVKEDREVTAEVVESVECRWCNRTDTVEVITSDPSMARIDRP